MNARAKDIQKRFEMANAERSMYDRGTKYYEQLSEVIKFILSEFGGNNKAIRARYFFAMSADGYKLICLN